MDLSGLFKQAGEVAAKNSPAILTAIGVTGTLTTAYLAAKAAFQSVDVLREAEATKEAEFHGEKPETEEGAEEKTFEGLTTQDKIEAVWELYLPAVASCAMTVVAIVCSNRISERRTAALASAYAFAEKSLMEYRAKTLEKIGKTKEEAIRDSIAEDEVAANPPRQSKIHIVDGKSTLCREEWNGRYFTGNIEDIRAAVNTINAQIIHENFVEVNEFWALLGVPKNDSGSEFGWDTDKLLEVDYSWTKVLDEQVLVITFRTLPVSRWANRH